VPVIMDGRRLAEEIREKVRDEVERLGRSGIEVGLGLMLVGDNPASRQYFMATLKACKGVGIIPHEFRLREDVSMNEILNIIHSINHDERINGLLILFPLPRRINARRVVNSITPEKDIDGLGSISVGRLAADESTFQLFRDKPEEITDRYEPLITGFLPCTPFGVIRLLEYYRVPIRGRHVVVIGKSLAVGKPLSLMFLAKEATVTICHRETGDLSFFTRQADIVCSATGVKGLIKEDMVKEGAVVVDIGINVLPDGRIVGDADFDSLLKKTSFITPVPGGVGPVTIAMLLENTVRSARRGEMMKNPFTIGG
jgi:methylenetetrahydrofolate dehydrogenase (NADP+)/methenyltetrahydrofolate cyclohydrolase